MPKLPGAFNAKEHEQLGDYSAIPAGVYIAQINQSELKNTKDGTGKRLVLSFVILEGEYAKRIVFQGLNLVNKSAQAVEIAQKELATLCKACGKVAIEDSDELHGIPIKIKVAVRPANANYAESNEIKMYYALEDGEVATPVSDEAEEKPKKRLAWD